MIGKKLSNVLELEVIDKFLEAKDCQKLMKYCSEKLERSNVIGDDKEHRTSYGVHLDINEIEDVAIKAILATIRNRTSFFTGLPTKNQESANVVKYSEGQEFKAHSDCFFIENEEHKEQYNRGGQRLFTLLLCLKKAKKGGETEFPNVNKEIHMKAGQALLWNNTDSTKNPLTQSVHLGKKVESGEKWALVIWVREGRFLNSPQD